MFVISSYTEIFVPCLSATICCLHRASVEERCEVIQLFIPIMCIILQGPVEQLPNEDILTGCEARNGALA